MPEYRQDLASGHNNLGVLLSDLGRLGEAEVVYRDGLKIQEQLTADSPTVPRAGSKL